MSDYQDPRNAPQYIAAIQEPPTTPIGILKRLGPGLIITGSIVGSGELIATTAIGAEAGFVLLWLVIIGCVIKVFAQIELGRFSIVNGETTLKALSQVPGPKFGKHGNWLVWFWVAMFVVGIGQLGGIVGLVGQAVTISVPITENGREYNKLVDDKVRNIREQTESVLRLQKELDATRRLLEKLSNQPATSAIVAEARTKVADEVAKLTITNDGKKLRKDQEILIEVEKLKAVILELKKSPETAGLVQSLDESASDQVEKRAADITQLDAAAKALAPNTHDDRYWGLILTIITVVILYFGKYNFIQYASTLLVASFTLVTVINVISLQLTQDWAITWADLQQGLSFHLPLNGDGLATALKAFGIIGVGASELVSYPYWCLEKGYARFTGPRDNSEDWARRAKGWMRVMRWDAWCSMFVYTFATIAFYLLGAAILGRSQLIPDGTETIRTLGAMYEPVFGQFAEFLFLFGAFAVLYSTFFVASASYGRTIPDAIRVLRFCKDDDATRHKLSKIVCIVFPFLCLSVYCINREPKQLILAAGFMQNMLLPMLGVAAIYFRYFRCDRRVKPGIAWDVFLWLSVLGLFISSGWALYQVIAKAVLID